MQCTLGPFFPQMILNSPLPKVQEIPHHPLQDLLGSHHSIELLCHVVPDQVLALLHCQLLPLPKGIDVGVVKNICASEEATKRPNCDQGSRGRAGFAVPVLPCVLHSSAPSQTEITRYLLSFP